MFSFHYTISNSTFGIGMRFQYPRVNEVHGYWYAQPRTDCLLLLCKAVSVRLVDVVLGGLR